MTTEERTELDSLLHRQAILQEEMVALRARMAALEEAVSADGSRPARVAPSGGSTVTPPPPVIRVNAPPVLTGVLSPEPSLASKAVPSDPNSLVPSVAEPASISLPELPPLLLKPLPVEPPPWLPPVPPPIRPPMVKAPPPAQPDLTPVITTSPEPGVVGAEESPVPFPTPLVSGREQEPVGLTEAPVPAPDLVVAMEQHAAEPPAPADESLGKPSFELRLGTYWLVRIGVVMILTGLVYLAGYAYKNYIGRIGPVGKVALLYLSGAVLLGAGAALQRNNQKTAVKNYGQVLFAGGLATVYFTTYAAHYFENLRVITSSALDGALLLAWAGYMVWLADRKKSEVLAFFGIGLAYYSSFITQVGLFTLYSNLVLTIASMFFLVRNRWAMLSVGSLIATYAGFAFWRFHHNHGWLWDWEVAQVWKGNWFLASYWVVLTAAVFLSRAQALVGGARVAFLTMNNGAFFTLVILSMLHVSRGSFWIFCLGYGSALVALAALARRFLAEDALTRNGYLIQGLLLITVGFIARFAGLNLALVLAAESLVLLVLANQLHNRVLQAGSQVVAALATGWLLMDQTAFDRAGLWVGSAVGAVMILNSYLVRPRELGNTLPLTWPPFFYTALGLVTWFLVTWHNAALPWRGFAFALESTLFVLASRPLRNSTLPLGAYPFAVCGVGYAILFQKPWDQVGLGTGLAIGALMLLNASWRRALHCSYQESPPSLQDSEPGSASGRSTPEGSPSAAQLLQVGLYTVLALGMWLVTTWNHTQPEWRGLIVAAEAAACLVARGLLKNSILGFGGCALAALAVGWHLSLLAPDQPRTLAGGAAIGGLMLFSSVWIRVRSPEPSSSSSRIEQIYFSALAQVMWLRTTWYAPADWRPLIFGGESVSLLLASRFLRVPVLEAGSYVAGLLGVGLGSWGMQRMDPDGAWRGAVIGGIMLLNAFEHRLNLQALDSQRKTLQETAFTVLALGMWLATTWQNTAPAWLGLCLGAESVAFLLGGGLSKNRILQFGGYGFASLAVGTALFEMVVQLPSVQPALRVGRYQSIALGMLMLMNALWERRSASDPTTQFRPTTALFTSLALATWFGATITFASPNWMAPLLAIEAAVLTGAWYPLRLRELALFGQIFLTAGQIGCVLHLNLGQPPVGSWQAPLVLVLSLGLLHWWQHQKGLSCLDAVRTTWQLLHSFAVAGILFFWLWPKFTPQTWLALTAWLAVLVTCYGVQTRAWFLAGFGQVFLLLSCVEFGIQLYARSSHPAWYCALSPIPTLFAFAGPLRRWLAQRALIPEQIHKSLCAVGNLYRCVGGFMLLGWVFEYLAQPDRFWFLVVVGLCFFAWGAWRREVEPLWVGLGFEMVGFSAFWYSLASPSVVYGPNLLAILALLGQQQMVRRRPAWFPVPPIVQPFLILLGGCSLWLFFSRLVMIKAGGFTFYLTATWAILALLLFCAGFLLRERVYRWHGLAVLGCALARVGLIDVWKLDTIYRILSFMALGVVLLVLGFIYNRHQEKIREWL